MYRISYTYPKSNRISFSGRCNSLIFDFPPVLIKFGSKYFYRNNSYWVYITSFSVENISNPDLLPRNALQYLRLNVLNTFFVFFFSDFRGLN